MAAKKIMAQVIPVWEAFLKHGGERDLISDLRSLPVVEADKITYMLGSHLTYHIFRTGNETSKVPFRNEQERLFRALRHEVHKKMDDVVWGYIQGLVKTLPQPCHVWCGDIKCLHRVNLTHSVVGITSLIRRELGMALIHTPNAYLPEYSTSLVRGEFRMPYAGFSYVGGIPFVSAKPGYIRIGLEKHEYQRSHYMLLKDWELVEEESESGTWVPVYEGYADMWTGFEDSWQVSNYELAEDMKETIFKTHPRFQTFRDCSELIPFL